MDARNQPSTVEVTSWDADNQQPVSGSGIEPQWTEPGNISATELAAIHDESPSTIRKGGSITSQEVQDLANAQLMRDRMAKLQCRVKILGNVSVEPGKLLEVAGVGDRFSGNLFVSGIRHEMVGGSWFTDIQLGLEPEWLEKSYLSPEPAVNPQSLGALYVGVVTQIHQDPAQSHRIQVRLPIRGDQDGIWARMATLDAGNDRGIIFRPEVGDEVVVGYLDDNPRQLVILGHLHSQAHAPPIAATQENHEKGIKTRSGMQLMFHEQEKSIIIKTPGNNQLTISDDQKGIILQDQNNNILRLDENGISLESAVISLLMHRMRGKPKPMAD